MLRLDEALQVVNDRKKPDSDIKEMIGYWEDVYYGMSLHTSGACPRFGYYVDGTRMGWRKPPNYFGVEYQLRFEYLLLASHPREDEVTRNWRYSQYKPYTQAPFQQIIETVTGAIFQDSNYTIDLPNEKDKEYIYGSNFEGHDLIGYFAQKFPSICEDPNGFFVVLPVEPGGNTTTPDIRPTIWFIHTKDIIWPPDGDDFIFKKGRTKWHINKIGIFRYQKLGKDWVAVEPEGYYAHMFQSLPIVKAGGKWNTQGFYESWLNKGKPVADDFIGSKSNEQLVDKEASHPFIVEPDTDCGECAGIGTKQRECTDCPDGIELISCSSCHGLGKVSRSPGMRIIAPIEQMDKTLVQIINPDVSINKYHNEKNKDLYWHLLDALCLTKVDQAQSGVAKTIDQERLHQFISNISNDIFDRVIFTVLNYIIRYRNVNNSGTPTVYDFTLIKPSQFQIKTASDLLTEFTQAKDARIPQFLKAQMAVDWVDKQYGGDYVMQKKTKVIKEADGLFACTTEEINLMIIGGTVDRRKAIFSQQLPLIIDGVVRGKGKEWFLKSDYEAIIEEVNKVFDANNPTVPELVDEDTPL